MKTIYPFGKLLLFSILAVLCFSACQKDEQINLTDAAETTITQRSEVPLSNRRKGVKLYGQFHYEDGYTDVWLNEQWESYGLEDLSAAFHVTDANSSIITFRSTDYRLSNRAYIYDNNGCAEVIMGLTYHDEFSTYLRINSTNIFNCIWPEQEGSPSI